MLIIKLIDIIGDIFIVLLCVEESIVILLIFIILGMLWVKILDILLIILLDLDLFLVVIDIVIIWEFVWLVIFKNEFNLVVEYWLLNFLDILFRILGFLIIFVYVLIDCKLFWIFWKVKLFEDFFMFINIWVEVVYLLGIIKKVNVVFIIRYIVGKISNNLIFFFRIFNSFIKLNFFFMVFFI